MMMMMMMMMPLQTNGKRTGDGEADADDDDDDDSDGRDDDGDDYTFAHHGGHAGSEAPPPLRRLRGTHAHPAAVTYRGFAGTQRLCRRRCPA